MKKIPFTPDMKPQTSVFTQYHILRKVFLTNKIFSYHDILQFEINFSYALKQTLGGKVSKNFSDRKGGNKTKYHFKSKLKQKLL